MDEFKPEDELKPDPSDRRTGRSRQSSERSERTERGEPQINFDDIELDVITFKRGAIFEKVKYHYIDSYTGTKLDYILNLLRVKRLIKKIFRSRNSFLLAKRYAYYFL